LVPTSNSPKPRLATATIAVNASGAPVQSATKQRRLQRLTFSADGARPRGARAVRARLRARLRPGFGVRVPPRAPRLPGGGYRGSVRRSPPSSPVARGRYARWNTMGVDPQASRTP
jgi:hypothetical protein